MGNYKKFKIQQQSYDGSSYTNVGTAVDTYEEFGVVCQEFPFTYMSKAKDVPSRDFHDEDGLDVFIPSGGLKMEAEDIEAKFLYSKSNPTGYDTYVNGGGTDSYDDWLSSNALSDILNFIHFLRGRNTGGAPYLAIYDEYTKIGLRGVYVTEVPNDIYEYSDGGIGINAVFKVKFKVTDPVTRLNSNFVVQ